MQINISLSSYIFIKGLKISKRKEYYPTELDVTTCDQTVIAMLPRFFYSFSK